MDKLLFTPGPLTTSQTVKQAMLHDFGSRDAYFIKIVREIRSKLLKLGNVSQEMGYETVIMQGSGTFGIESVLSSAVPKNGKLLVAINGSYGERIAKIASIHQLPHIILACEENELPDLEQASLLLEDGGFTHMAIVHCETTSGILNPIQAFGDLAKRHGVTYIVDSMSAFGGIPLDIASTQIGFLISSSNKCIEGVPGFSFVIAKKEELLRCKGQADTLVLDLYSQWMGLETDGQFRFTPPTHALLAFAQALQELELEGGIAGRHSRYSNSFNTLREGMLAMGFKEYLLPELQSPIISSYHYPANGSFDFAAFYKKLNEKGHIIYPGKLSKANCFRIGNIGHLYKPQIDSLLKAIQEVKEEMGF